MVLPGLLSIKMVERQLRIIHGLNNPLISQAMLMASQQYISVSRWVQLMVPGDTAGGILMTYRSWVSSAMLQLILIMMASLMR